MQQSCNNTMFFSRFAPTYETGTARLFWHGRTETVRTCTNEVANFCKAIDNPAVTVCIIKCV